MPMAWAIFFACAAVSRSEGRRRPVMIFSGWLCATSSMSMPPSLEAIKATFCVARSVTIET
jgi:hypothetical protein